MTLTWLIVYPVTPFPSLIKATGDEIQAQMNRKCFTSADLVKAYIERIGEVDKTFCAITELNPDAVEEARTLDMRNLTTKRGPLYGLPIVLKNVIATKDKLGNTGGSYALYNATNTREAGVAKKLRSAGAIILGKANLSQLGGYRSRRHVNGWSSHGGQVKGAYLPSQDPGGSSSGSAVAVDLGLAFAALGVDSIGSILVPAGRNNIVAIRPTLGLTSRDQVIPVSEHFDVVGPMARTVRDAAYVLQAIAGRDGYDAQTWLAPDPVPDYAAACDGATLKGRRIGVPWTYIHDMIQGAPLNDELWSFHKALNEMRDAGAVVIPTQFTMVKELQTWNNEVLSIDFVANMDNYLANLETVPTGVRSLIDLRDWTQLKRELEDYPNRDTEFWDQALKDRDMGWTQKVDSQVYQRALARLKDLGGKGGILGAIERSRLDAVVMPTSISPGCVPLTGGPAVTVPLGSYPDRARTFKTVRGNLVDAGPGLPFGLTFAGKPWDETKLISIAHAFEGISRVRNKLRRRLVNVPSSEVGGSAHIMALVDYSSSSSTSSEAGNTRQPPSKRIKSDGPAIAAPDMPPLPAAFHDLYASTVRYSVVDDPGLHQGRKRQNPHVPGCWPSHVYVEWHPTQTQHETLGQLLSKVEVVVGQGIKLHRFLSSDLGVPLPLHISLSRPLSLRTANKDAFLDRLTQSIRAAGVAAFAVSPCGLAWYKSPDSDRTFLILRVAVKTGLNPQLTALLARCNTAVSLFGQPKLYQGTRDEAVGVAFHVSIAWTFGLPGEEATLETLKLFKQKEFFGMSSWQIDVSGVKAKIGNIVTHIPLAEHGAQADVISLTLA
ncbi:hypothetical protein CP533_1233 [Ophiocordyceps camponoti-saundersi (nom. inval.)]|nr:hypothetical protein CP533_1233 [Ophiocordyceps camponoti-saundersi (nom. inval.)]